MIDRDKQKSPQIKLNFEKAETKYVNLAVLSHSQAEFIIDFARMLPGQEKPEAQDRMIMTPLHAKLLLLALKENIDKFENRFGEIQVPQEAKKGMSFKA
ncbi:MAG: DUF3467 domain-containing protein [candidate division WOR-3 bacterium]|nr:DUF3467 domain-containing protein [candidate division WOR-3 bacterium]